MPMPSCGKRTSTTDTFLCFSDLAKASQALGESGNVGLDIVIQENERRLFRLPGLPPSHGAGSVLEVAWREWIASVAVLIANPSVATVDHHIGALVAGKPASDGQGFLLGAGHPCRPTIAVPFDGHPLP